MEATEQTKLNINFKTLNKINKSTNIDNEIKALVNSAVQYIVSEGNYNPYQEQLLREYKIVK
jgi:hypothetical protein